MAKREKMSPIDTAWLRMDRPSNLMMIVGVMTFDQRIDFERLKNTLEQRLVRRYDRFRQRVHQDALGPWWEDDPEFDLNNHFVRRALPQPAGKTELQRLASEMATEALNPARPLWRFDLIEDYQGGSALVSRIHHCIADGIALVGVMLSMTDPTAEGSPMDDTVQPARKKRRRAEDPLPAFLHPVSEATSAAFGMTGKLWHESTELVSDPDKMKALGKHGAGFAAELGKLLVMPADSPTRFKGKTGTMKQVAWCEPIPLVEVKALGKALDCSVNDVLLSAVAGALRQYLERAGDDVSNVEVRAMVPVNMRGEGDAGKLGNKFGMVTLLLPVFEANPIARLFEVRSRMREMKGSYQPPLTMALLGVSGLAPKFIQERFLDMLANKASAVMTNVPGPREALYLAGSRIGQIMFWVPQSGDIGIGVSILSYNDFVQFGLITDRRFVPDPEEITSLFGDEFERMMMTMMLHHDWDQPVDPEEIERGIEEELGISQPEMPKPVGSRRGKRAAAPTENIEQEEPTGKRGTRNQAQPTRAASQEPAPAATPARVPKRFRNL